jgi:hypothetical protein
VSLSPSTTSPFDAPEFLFTVRYRHPARGHSFCPRVLYSLNPPFWPNSGTLRLPVTRCYKNLENCDVYDAHCVNTFASKTQNDENDVMEHTLQNENDEQSRAQEAVATDVVTVSEQIRPQGKKKAQNSRKRKADSHEGSSALDESAASLATSSLKLSEAYERSQKMKVEIAVRQIAVEEAKAQVDKMKAQVDICKILLDPTASATEAEKKNVRKKLLECLKLEADPE